MDFLLNKRRGLTLLETLMYVAILAITIAFTLRAVGEARMIRGNARDRAALVLIAQSELERWRIAPAAQLSEGAMRIENPSWPSGASATVSLRKTANGLWEIDVRVRRKGPEGKPEVRLTTIRTGAQP